MTSGDIPSDVEQLSEDQEEGVILIQRGGETEDVKSEIYSSTRNDSANLRQSVRTCGENEKIKVLTGKEISSKFRQHPRYSSYYDLPPRIYRHYYCP